MHVGVTIEPDDLYDGFTHQIHHKVGELIHDKAYAAHIPAHWASIKLIEGDAWWRKPGLSQRERDELEAVCREYEGAYDLGDRETLIADAATSSSRPWWPSASGGAALWGRPPCPTALTPS